MTAPRPASLKAHWFKSQKNESSLEILLLKMLACSFMPVTVTPAYVVNTCLICKKKKKLMDVNTIWVNIKINTNFYTYTSWCRDSILTRDIIQIAERFARLLLVSSKYVEK